MERSEDVKETLFIKINEDPSLAKEVGLFQAFRPIMILMGVLNKEKAFQRCRIVSFIVTERSQLL